MKQPENHVPASVRGCAWLGPYKRQWTGGPEPTLAGTSLVKEERDTDARGWIQTGDVAAEPGRWKHSEEAVLNTMPTSESLEGLEEMEGCGPPGGP